MKFDKLIRIARPLIPMVVGRGIHFSFILDGKKILSMGHAQSFKTSPLAKKYGHRYSAIHSELHAIRRFPLPVSELRNCTMVNIRFLKNGRLAMARPCIYCQSLLADFEVGELYYTNYIGEFEKYEGCR